MHLDQIENRFRSFRSRAGENLIYRFAAGATLEAMQRAEAHLAVEFPEQVARFWLAFDGLEVLDPPFKILPLSEMKRNGELLTFCYCDRTAEISFDVRAHNQAAQWSIVNASTRYVVTFTLASFWSTHLWSWILKRRTFWHERAASEGSPIR